MPDAAEQLSPRIADLTRRLQKEPSSRVFLELAREFYDNGSFEQAADVCVKGLRQYPTYLSARVLLGRIYFDMGCLPESRAEMETALSQAPDNLIARRILAEISLEEGDAAGALDRYRALLAFNPTDDDVRKRVEEIEQRLANPAAAPAPEAPAPAALSVATQPEAVEAAEPAALAPGVLATPTLAAIYEQQGLTAQAVAVYREILKGDPDNEDARVRLAELEAPRPARRDPDAESRTHKIAALNRWLSAIRGGHGVS
jgi:tetratricopeptide (TPR) repeat protein